MIHKKIKSVLTSEDLLKHASIMFIFSVLASICNYAFQVYMGRALGPEDYGIFGSLFAISYMIYLVTATIQTTGARYVSKFVGEKHEDEINNFLRSALKRMALLGIILFLGLLFVSNWLSSFLKIGSIDPIIILGSTLLFSTLLPVNLGVIQGLEKFKSLGLTNLVLFSSKLMIGVLLVYIGFGVNGAIAALVFGTIFALIFSFIPIRSYLKKPDIRNHSFNFLNLYKYSIPTLIAMFCYSVPANVDVIIAKHFFSDYDAGIYVAVSVLGKIMIFLPGAIVDVMFPKVSKRYSEKKGTVHLLNLSLLYTGLGTGILAALFWFFPSQIIEIPFGAEYIGAAPLIQLYGLTTLFFSLTVVIMRFNLAIHNTKYVYLLLSFTVLEVGLLSVFNNDPMEMIRVLLVVNVVLFIASYVYVKLNVNFLKNANGVNNKYVN